MNTPEIRPRVVVYRGLLLFHRCVVFHCVNIPQYVYPIPVDICSVSSLELL